MARVKLVTFLSSPLWIRTEEAIKTEKYSSHNKISAEDKEVFAEIKKCLMDLSEIFLYSPEFKDSNLSQILSIVRGQNATA